MLKKLAKPFLSYLNRQFGDVHTNIHNLNKNIDLGLISPKPSPEFPVTIHWNYDMLMRDERMMMLLGELHANRVKALPANTPINEAEFSVFSQTGEDGIIQFILAHTPNVPKSFIEFGVGTYIEANTRFLLKNNYWRGLLLEAEESFVRYIKTDKICWSYDLTVVQSFITIDNINQLIGDAGFSGDIGLLSVDIDGNDYWIWDKIDVVNPTIVICEYNAAYGSELAVTIPYKEDFARTQAHYSDLYYGVSLPALCHLADKKGYELVACNRMRHNAFFIKKDCGHSLTPLKLTSELTNAPYRHSRGKDGKLNFLRGDARLQEIADCRLYDIKTDTIRSIRELYTLR